MNQNSDPFEELHELISALFADTIDAEQDARLRQLIKEDDASRWYYVKYVDLIGSLHYEGAADDESLPASDRPDQAVSVATSPVSGFLSHGVQQITRFITTPTPLSITVALLTIVSLLSLASMIAVPWAEEVAGGPDATALAEWAVVARVSQTIDCQWAAGERAWSAGSQLIPRDTLTLDVGLAEITFKSGVRVTLQGPAVLHLKSGNYCHLEQGRMTAYVPRRAQGFAVNTPFGKVIDLGTEFGVEVQSSRWADVYVFAGKVEAETIHREKTTRHPLAAGEGLRMAASGDVSIIDAKSQLALAKRFRRVLQPKLDIRVESGPVGTFVAAKNDLINRGQATLANVEVVSGSLSDAILTRLHDGIWVYAADTLADNAGAMYSPSGSVVLLRLNTSVNTDGYDITQIVSVSGRMVKPTRLRQNYMVDVATVGVSGYRRLFWVHNLGDDPMGEAPEIKVTTEALDSQPLARGVETIRITFLNNNAQDNETMYRELDVFGVPTVKEKRLSAE